MCLISYTKKSEKSFKKENYSINLFYNPLILLAFHGIYFLFCFSHVFSFKLKQNNYQPHWCKSCARCQRTIKLFLFLTKERICLSISHSRNGHSKKRRWYQKKGCFQGLICDTNLWTADLLTFFSFRFLSKKVTSLAICRMLFPCLWSSRIWLTVCCGKDFLPHLFPL